MQSMTLQYLLLALALLWSIAFIVQRQFPSALRALRVRLVLRLLASSRPAWQQRLGRKLAPPPAIASTCAVGSGCGGCEKAGSH
ncbi:MAG: hypothetical protein CVV12_09180 [Gammaproteobacteria bacterium HGW-Gammaproteobacteria-2]|jgi:hypothetical protein|nr:MAG: hypothetical protein CVV12_09180 [Gammaproteobacteria bacterium HGW-Gammaproteobacteria-2]